MEQVIGTIRRFNTKNFTVVVDALEDYDVDLSFDDTGEVREKLNSGEYVCFTARVRVIFKGSDIAADYLGGCIYSDIQEFADHRQCGISNRAFEANGDAGRCGSYFADMISTAISEARKHIADMQSVHVRLAA